MDIISLLATQPAASSSGRQNPTQGQALTDFAQVIARVADTLKPSAATSATPGFGEDAEALAFPGLQAGQTGSAHAPLAEPGALPEGLMEALRDNLRRGAQEGGVQEAGNTLADELAEVTLPETGNLPALEQLSALAAATVGLTGTLDAVGNAQGDARLVAPAQPATTAAAQGMAPSADTSGLAGSQQFLATAATSAVQPGATPLHANQLAAGGRQAAMTAPSGIQEVTQLPTDAGGSQSPLVHIDGQAAATTGGRESSPWAAEQATSPALAVAAGRAESVGGPSAGALEAAALSGPQQGSAGSPATPVAQATLSQNLAAPGWSQQFGQQMLQFVQRGDRQVELRLNPAELGPLSISLRVDEQGAQAHFLSAHASVRAAVEQAIPQLRETLAEQGITLAEAQVGEQGFGRSRDQAGQDSGGRGQPEQLTTGSEPIVAAGSASTSLERGLPGAVDTWA